MSDSLTSDQPTLPDLTPGSPTRLILDRAAVLGILDTEHVDDLSRYMRDRALPELVKAGWLRPFDTDGHLRANRAGRSPDTYLLTSDGAEQARAIGHAQAHAYAQQNRVNQSHDVVTLDIRRLAEQAGLTVVTERQLVHAPKIVQPDNTITLPGNSLVLFESEGPADAHQRPRILSKVLDWAEAANALRGLGADLNVRVVFNVKAGRAFDEVCATWAQAIAAAQAGLERPLALKFWGQLVSTFRETPIWDRLEGFARLDDPALVKSKFGLASQPKAAPAAPDQFDPLSLLPAGLRRQTVAFEQDITWLRANAHYFNVHLADKIPALSAEFFDLMRELHSLAFPATNDIRRMSLPLAALFALRRYIQHYSDLRQALIARYRRYQYAIAIKMTLQYADDLICAFLNFHGLRHDSPDCSVWIQSPDQDYGRTSCLKVQVRLNLPRLWDMHAQDWERFERETEQAMAWVLQQLLDYPELLGIAGEEVKLEHRSKR